MSEKWPSVSVVISTHNRAHLLGRAIGSVLSQTYRDFELIIVDDASADNTGEVVNNFSDKRIQYTRHDKSKGGPAARNTGIKMAQGSYIAFLDDDDEWLPSKLEKQVARMREVGSGVGLIYTGSQLVAEDGSAGRTYIPEHAGNVCERLLWGSLVGGLSTVLTKKECFERVGMFDESLASCQDWDMWKRISESYQFDFVPEILTRIHMHGAQISTDLGAMIPGRTRMVQKHLKEFQRHPDILVVHSKQLGKLHCMNGTWSEAVYWFKQAAKINKCEWIKIAAWCLIELPIMKMFSRDRRFVKYRRDSHAHKNTPEQIP